MKKMYLTKTFLAAAMAAGIALSATFAQDSNGSTIIEPFGLLFENFNGNVRQTTAVSLAPGITATHSAYGALTGTTPASHTQTYSFTPGVTPGNYDSNGLSQSDLGEGTGTGHYNVYATWPHSTTMSGGGSTFTLSGPDGVLFSLGPIDLNAPSIGTNTWALLGTALLNANESYTLAITPQAHGFSSQFITGVMFEPYIIPEPSTYAAIFGGLALVGAFVYRRRLSAKK